MMSRSARLVKRYSEDARAFPLALSKGFTLVELMVALVVLAILAMIAVPSYNSYMMRSRRTDAITELLTIQSLQTRWRANHPTYGTLADLSMGATSAAGHYTLAIAVPTAVAYTATATTVAGGRQASDSACAVFTLTQAGPDISTAVKQKCWNQ
jgi:type IV pilus assembly protein PilE